MDACSNTCMSKEVLDRANAGLGHHELEQRNLPALSMLDVIDGVFGVSKDTVGSDGVISTSSSRMGTLPRHLLRLTRLHRDSVT